MSSRSLRSGASPTGCEASCWGRRFACSQSSSGGCTRCTETTCRSTRGCTTACTGTSSSCRGRRGWPGSSSAPACGSIRFRPSRRPASSALLPGAREPLLPETARGVDRRTEVETLVLRLLDQHHRLERVHVVDALLLALGRDLRLVRPVVELHLRDACDTAHLPEVELDLVQVFCEIDRLQQVDVPRVRHRVSSFSSLQPRVETYTCILPKKEGFPPERLRRRRRDSGSVAVGAVVARLDDGSERGDRLALAQAHHDHALGGAAETLDVLDGHLDHRPAGRDQHHLVAVADDAGAGEAAAGLAELDGLDAEPAAALPRVLGDAGAIPVAVLGHD